MNRSEHDAIANRRLQQFVAGIDRAADHQVAHLDWPRIGEDRVNRMLDGSNPIALRDGELQRVVARRQARPA